MLVLWCSGTRIKDGFLYQAPGSGGRNLTEWISVDPLVGSPGKAANFPTYHRGMPSVDCGELKLIRA